jgi:hypothetical protein
MNLWRLPLVFIGLLLLVGLFMSYFLVDLWETDQQVSDNFTFALPGESNIFALSHDSDDIGVVAWSTHYFQLRNTETDQVVKGEPIEYRDSEDQEAGVPITIYGTHDDRLLEGWWKVEKGYSRVALSTTTLEPVSLITKKEPTFRIALTIVFGVLFGLCLWAGVLVAQELKNESDRYEPMLADSL